MRSASLVQDLKHATVVSESPPRGVNNCQNRFSPQPREYDKLKCHIWNDLGEILPKMYIARQQQPTHCGQTWVSKNVYTPRGELRDNHGYVARSVWRTYSDGRSHTHADTHTQVPATAGVGSGGDVAKACSMDLRAWPSVAPASQGIFQ